MVDSFIIRTSAVFWISLALMILILPIPWIFAILLSSFVHELWHLIAVRITGVSVKGLRLGVHGVYLETEPMTPLQELICSLAGPLGALLLLPVARWMPRTSLCAAVQSSYHLLPVLPLDGGRALRSLTAYFGWRRCICDYTEKAVLMALILAGLYLTVAAGFGLLPAVMSFVIIFRICREKYLANGGRTGYNRCTN